MHDPRETKASKRCRAGFIFASVRPIRWRPPSTPQWARDRPPVSDGRKTLAPLAARLTALSPAHLRSRNAALCLTGGSRIQPDLVF